jgi:purine-binding chemotaxis protein CheW
MNPDFAASASATARPDAAAIAGCELLTFTLGAEAYGVDILKVQEIRGYDAVTRIPDAPDWLKGVINLRGTIVPVIDLRIKFRLGDVGYDDLTVMIILNLGARVVGIVVDGVSDVTRLTPEQIRPTPAFGAGIDTDYIAGLGVIDGRMLILVDIERLLAAADLAVLAGSPPASH